ncbi:hypothetical protein EOD42_08955 [Rhodovarius crocodyli]|uniref:Uncharacterized protein n=1 Tax=Rhodovarius crocodyli TaxID=1979269 RepID=A0A437MJZ9_9PROT|nr:hypothetical protein EOD42_08955 [Rhodovarius crocodyli]
MCARPRAARRPSAGRAGHAAGGAGTALARLRSPDPRLTGWPSAPGRDRRPRPPAAGRSA